MKDLALKALSTDALPPFLEKRDTLVETKGLNVEETAGNKNEAEDINSYSKLIFTISFVCFFCFFFLQIQSMIFPIVISLRNASIQPIARAQTENNEMLELFFSLAYIPES